MQLALLILFAVPTASATSAEQETLSIVVSGESLPCVNLQKLLVVDNTATRGELTSVDVERLFALRGGVFRSDKMARNREEAMRNFRAPATPDGQFLSMGEVKNLLKEKISNQSEVVFSELGVEALASEYNVSSQFTGYHTVVEFCLNRGTPMHHESQYLRMCTVCSTITYTPKNVWPPLLYGAICDSRDNECLYEGHKANGKCFVEEMAMDILVQSGDMCILVLRNGERLVTQDWTLHQHTIGIGCICAVNKNSPFR